MSNDRQVKPCCLTHGRWTVSTGITYELVKLQSPGLLPSFVQPKQLCFNKTPRRPAGLLQFEKHRTEDMVPAIERLTNKCDDSNMQMPEKCIALCLRVSNLHWLTL